MGASIVGALLQKLASQMAEKHRSKPRALENIQLLTRIYTNIFNTRLSRFGTSCPPTDTES